MTAREQTIIRAVIKVLRGGERTIMDAYAISYGLPLHLRKPMKDTVADLLEALANDS